MRRAGLRGLAALPRRARTTDSRHGYPIAPNRLARNFEAAAPNQVWLADLTYIPTGEAWLYLAAILDMHTRKIVGWSMRQTLHTEIALDALNMAVERQRPAPGLIHHSDRGIQGGLNWSSQHFDRGGCDGHSEAALASRGFYVIGEVWRDRACGSPARLGETVEAHAFFADEQPRPAARGRDPGPEGAGVTT